ncbi:MAG: FAD-dependent oxidoreductase [Pseudanabaena sp.]|nr:MAG: FAD-dependent oxidoreductase [Pseudanabaena sp.]
MATVTIIGCGVVGAMLAYELRHTGLEVEVVEAKSCPAMVSTGAALGVLMAACSSKAKGDLVNLRLKSLSKYDRLIADLEQQTNLNILYNRKGILNLYRSPEAETKSRSLIEIRKEQGFELQWLENTDISARFSPWQADGGLFSPCDRAVHPTQLVNALVAAASLEGVKFHWNTPIKDLQDVSSDRVVITAGVGSNQLLTKVLGKSNLLQAVGGQALLVEVPNLNLLEVIHFENEDGSDVNVVPLGYDRYWLGATVEFEYDQLPCVANEKLLLEQAIAWCPLFENAKILQTWAGDRPRPQGARAPILGFVPDSPHILLATGHYRNGVLMAPVTAEITRDLLLNGDSDLPWRPFAL